MAKELPPPTLKMEMFRKLPTPMKFSCTSCEMSWLFEYTPENEGGVIPPYCPYCGVEFNSLNDEFLGVSGLMKVGGST